MQVGDLGLSIGDGLVVIYVYVLVALNRAVEQYLRLAIVASLRERDTLAESVVGDLRLPVPPGLALGAPLFGLGLELLLLGDLRLLLRVPARVLLFLLRVEGARLLGLRRLLRSQGRVALAVGVFLRRSHLFETVLQVARQLPRARLALLGLRLALVGRLLAPPRPREGEGGGEGRRQREQ